MSGGHRRRPRPARRRLAALAAGLALGAAACGIPEGEPQALPREGREDLLEGTTTTTTTIVGPSDNVTHRLFFIGPDDKLETIERTYPANVRINTVLKDLEQPPQPEEQPTDEEVGLLRSLVPDGLDATLLEETPEDQERGVRMLQVAPVGGLRQLLDESPVQGRLVVSQVVCTFLRVSPEGTVGVEIRDDEGIIPLTDDAAQPINGPADEDDFGGCQTGTEEREELVEAGSESTTSSTEAPGDG